MPQTVTHKLEPGNVISITVLKEEIQMTVLKIEKGTVGKFNLTLRPFPSGQISTLPHVPAHKAWDVVGQDFDVQE